MLKKLCAIKSFILLLTLLGNVGFSQSIEQGNAFNKFMGAEDGVNPLSGSVAFKKTLATISSGMATYSVEMSYSGNVQEIVKNKNDIALTGWVGLGWSLGHAKIVADNAGTMWIDDDTYYLQTEAGISFKIVKGNNGKWWLEGLPYWIVSRKTKTVSYGTTEYSIVIGWELISDAGVKYVYGDNGNLSASHATEFTIANPYSLGIVGVVENGTTSQYPSAWNLAKIEDYNGNYLIFSYEQYMEKVRKNITFDSKLYVTKSAYTKECYLKSIESSKGEKIVFNTERKNYYREFIDNKGEFEDNSGEFIDDNGVFVQPETVIPDPYIDPMERRFLSQIVIYGNNGEPLKYIDLCYEPLDVMIKGAVNQDYVKRLLVSIAETSKGGNEIQKETFTYIREELDKNNNPLPLGAMESIMGPNCGVVKYEYKEMTLLDLDVATRLHKDHVPLTDFVAGKLDDGTEYIVGEGSVYIRTPSGWKIQQDNIKGDPYSYPIVGENWFITKKNIDIQRTKFTYYLYVWNGREWKDEGEYTDDNDKNFVEIGPNYLLVAHAADGKLTWQIPWSKWGETYSGEYTHVDTDPSDRDEIKLLAGRNHFAFYYKKSWDFFANGVLKIRSFEGNKKFTKETFGDDNLDYVEIGLLDDNTIIGVNEDGDEAFAYHGVENEDKVFTWKYIRLAELNGWHGRESFQVVGDDYFAVKHNDNDNMSLFWHNGKGWTCKCNRDMVHHQNFDPATEAEWDAIPGHDFFVARQPRIKEHWYGNEIKPFREYQRYERDDDGEWRTNDRVSSGDEKIIFAGSDWYFIKNNQIGYIRNGFDWNFEDYAEGYSRFLLQDNQRNSEVRGYSTKGGDFLVEKLVKGKGANIYYKKNDSFKGAVKGFFVSKKHVMDPVVDKVVSYGYDYVAHSLGKSPTYDFMNKEPSVSAYTITLPDRAGVVEKILCDEPQGVARGEICEEKYYNSAQSKKPVKTIKKEYSRYPGENWPNQIYLDRLVSTTSTANNLTKTEKYNYADGINGLVSSVILYDNNTNKNISEVVDKYAVELYKGLKNYNRLTEKTATYQCVPDCKNGKIVSGDVVTYDPKHMRAFEQWTYAPKKDERVDASSFDLTSSFPSNAWTKVKSFTKYHNEFVNEMVDQYGKKSAKVLEWGAINWNVADVSNASLDQILVLPGDACNVQDWFDVCSEIPLSGRTYENDNSAAATYYGRFAKTAILVDGKHKLVGNLGHAKPSKYRFSAWAQGTSSVEGRDKIRLSLNSSMKKEFSLKGNGTWEYIEWLSEYDLDEKSYELSLSTVDYSKVHLQDIRLVPEDAHVNVVFYDKVWGKVIAKSDDRSVGSYIVYDDLGRIIETYGETAEGTIVKKSRTTYSPGVCAVSSNYKDALKELIINGESIVVSTTPGQIEIAVKNSTEDLNVSWKSYVDGEKVFYSLQPTGDTPKYEKTNCAGSCSVSDAFVGNSMTLKVAVSSISNPYTIIINRSTTGWIDYGTPLTKGYNPVFLSNNNVSGVRYLSERGIEKVKYNGSKWIGLSEPDEENLEDKKNSYVSVGGAINNGVDYIFALPNFVGVSDGSVYYYYTSDLNALGFKDATSFGQVTSWDDMGSFDKDGVKSDKYHMVTSLDNKTYLLYERTEYTEMPKAGNSRLRTFSDQTSIVVKKLNGNSWVEMGTVAYSAEKRDEKNSIEGRPPVKTTFPFTDADIAVGKNFVPYVVYIGNVQDYSVQTAFVNSNVDDDELGEDKPDVSLLQEFVANPSILVVKHYDASKNKWIGFESEKGDILKLSNGIPLPNANKVKLASDGTNLYMAVLYNDGLSSKYALKVYRMIEENSKLKFEEQIDNSFGSAIIAYLEENDHFDLAVHNNKPFVSFVNSANKGYVTVVKYDGGHWRSVGSPAFANVSSQKNSADLAVDVNGMPYVVLREGTLSNNVKRINKIVPMKYSADGDLDLTIKSIGDIPETSLAKDFRQYILNYDAAVPMTVESIPLNISFQTDSHVNGIEVKNNGKPVYAWKRNQSYRFMGTADEIQTHVPSINVKLNNDVNEIQIIVYGSEKIPSLAYAFRIRREFVYGLDFNAKMMGSEIGLLTLKDKKYVTNDSPSSEDVKQDNPYNPGVEFDVPATSVSKSSVTTVENYEYKIYPSDEDDKYQKMCLEYNSVWFMKIKGFGFSKPECFEYDVANDEFIVSSNSSSMDESSSSVNESSSSAKGNQIFFVDAKGNEKIITIVVANTSSSSYGMGETIDESSSSQSSSSQSNSSQSRNIDGTAIPIDYSSLYRYKFVADADISIENNVSVLNGDFVTSTIYVAAGANVLGNILCSSNMSLSSNAYVQTIILGGQLNTQSGAKYGALEQKSIKVPSIAQRTFKAGKEQVVVRPGGSMTLTPGAYGDVSIYANSNVTLTSGSYYFKSLYIAPDANVKTENVDAPLQIWVQENIRIDDRSTFMIDKSFNKVFVYGNGSFDVYVGVDTKVSATLVYPNGKVNLAPYSEYAGLIWANSINVGANSIIK